MRIYLSKTDQKRNEYKVFVTVCPTNIDPKEYWGRQKTSFNGQRAGSRGQDKKLVNDESQDKKKTNVNEDQEKVSTTTESQKNSGILKPTEGLV